MDNSDLPTEKECINCQSKLIYGRNRNVQIWFDDIEKFITIEAWYCPECRIVMEVE